MNRSLALVVLMLGCNASPSTTPLARTEHKIVDARDDRRILAGEAPLAPAQTDLRPARPLVLQIGTRLLEPPAPSWTGRLTATGAVWVTIEEKLVDQNGTTLDEEVSPEVAVSADGHRVAYTKGFPNGVWVLDLRGGQPPRLATSAMHDANQPIFHGDHRLVVAGAATDEMYGIWVVELDGGQAPRAITNGHLHIGKGIDGSFVPPPARHESMKIVGETLHYDDGVGERTVQVGPAR